MIADYIEAGLYEGLWMAICTNREAEILESAAIERRETPAIFPSPPAHPMLINLKKATLVDQPHAGANWNTVSSQLIRPGESPRSNSVEVVL